MKKTVLLLLLILVMTVTGYGQQVPNAVDAMGHKQGPWKTEYPARYGDGAHIDSGAYKDGLKDGRWIVTNRIGDTIAIENYTLGLKDSINLYFTPAGKVRQESWYVRRPGNAYDTVRVFALDQSGDMEKKQVKNTAYNYKNGTWVYWDPNKGTVLYREIYDMGELKETRMDVSAAPSNQRRSQQQMAKDSTTYVNSENKILKKPKEVLEYEKKNKDKEHKERTGETGL